MLESPLIQIQSPILSIHHETVMFVPDREGWIGSARSGLFAYDTRYLSKYELSFEGARPRLLAAARKLHNLATLTYGNPTFRAGPVDVPEMALILVVRRALDVDFLESIDVTSYAPTPIEFRLILSLESAFDDLFEVRDLSNAPPRVIRSQFDPNSRTLSYIYRDGTFSRRLDHHIDTPGIQIRHSPNLLIFPIKLDSRESWRIESVTHMSGEPRGVFSLSDVSSRHTSRISVDNRPGSISAIERRALDANEEVENWLDDWPAVSTPNHVVRQAYDQSLRDLASLRLLKVDNEWFPAAGVPWYNAVFGRDSLVTALQTAHFGCPFGRAVLTLLAKLQGTRVNRTTDEEPGKIPHELRVGELTVTGRIPFGPFYATVDASLLYVILVAELFQFTGDDTVLRQYSAACEKCVQWAAEYGDVDGDGFVEYWMRSPADYPNQGWKDAEDAVVYPDGRIVPDPIAIVEVQGYYYAALLSLAMIRRRLGDTSGALDLERRAAALKQRFNRTFWLEDRQYFAYGLDNAKRPIESFASNPGQLLWTGIVDQDRAVEVVERLGEDMFDCGWGVRTLSSSNGAYAPAMYQRGSIWPHDNSLIAFGMKRHGLWRDANRIAEGIFAASGYFVGAQLPELWVGLDRRDTTWPIVYLNANVPQAWAAGSVSLLLRAILGIDPDQPNRRLLLSPTLPDWLDDLTLLRVPFLDGQVDLRFRGRGMESQVEVLRLVGSFTVEQVAVRKEGE